MTTNAAVPSGVISNGLTVGNLETLYVSGTAIATSVTSGGEIVTLGFAAATMVGNGGTERVSGTADGSVILSGGSESNLAGSTVSGAVISSGGTQSIVGTASGTTLNGGLEILASSAYFAGPGQTSIFYGSALGTVIDSGGLAFIGSGNLASGTVVNTGGILVVTPQARVTGTTGAGQVISTGVVQYASNGTFSTGTTPLSGIVSGGAIAILSGTGAVGAVLSSAVETVYGGGVTTATVLANGATEIVDSGGIVSGTIVKYTIPDTHIFNGLYAFTIPGAAETIMAGGSAMSSVVLSGGFQTVQGTTMGTTVYSGGEAYVSSGTTTGTVLSGGLELIQSAGVAASTTVLSGGVLEIGQTPFYNLAVSTTGTIVSSGGTEHLYQGVARSTVISGGGLQIIDGGNAVGATILSGGSQTITMAGGTATNTTVSSGATQILAVSGANATGTTLAAGGRIDVQYLAYAPDASATITSGGVLSITEYGQTYTQQLGGSYTNLYFALAPDTGGGTVITAAGTPCYCRGTLILTSQGERPVETLAIGDRVMTQSGAARPIRWIGRRSYTGRFARGNAAVLPIYFKAGSLDGRLPRRDLFVSPLHAMAIDGLLIPAALLVNGITILQAETVDQVDYIHIELETHDIIWAEGAPSETFIDDGSRGMFHNAAEYAALYPEATRTKPHYCAPRLEQGDLLEAIKLRLQPRPQLGTLRGAIDLVTRSRVAGWAWAQGGRALRLCITCNGVKLGSLLADEWRPDLQQAGFGTGHHGFNFTIPGGLPPRQHQVVDVTTLDKQPLPGSPWILESTAAEAA